MNEEEIEDFPVLLEVMEAVSYWESYFSLVSGQRIDKEMFQVVQLLPLI